MIVISFFKSVKPERRLWVHDLNFCDVDPLDGGGCCQGKRCIYTCTNVCIAAVLLKVFGSGCHLKIDTSCTAVDWPIKHYQITYLDLQVCSFQIELSLCFCNYTLAWFTLTWRFSIFLRFHIGTVDRSSFSTAHLNYHFQMATNYLAVAKYATNLAVCIDQWNSMLATMKWNYMPFQLSATSVSDKCPWDF